MALNHLTRELSETPAYLLSRRQRELEYVKRCHLSHTHFLNVIRIPSVAFYAHLPAAVLSSRLQRWWLLSISLGDIAAMHPSTAMLRAVMQLLDELEAFTEAASSSAASSASGAASPPLHPSAHLPIHVRRPMTARSHAQDVAADSSRASSLLHRSGNSSSKQYEYLLVGGVGGGGSSSSLEYARLVAAMMSLLVSLYHHMLALASGGGEGGGGGKEFAELVLRIDRRVKALVLDRVSDDLLRVAVCCINAEQSRCLNALILDPDAATGGSMRHFHLDKQRLVEHS